MARESFPHQFSVRLNDKQFLATDACSAPLGLSRSEFVRKLLDYLPDSVDSIKYSTKGIEIISGSHLFEISCIDLDYLPH